MIVKFAEGKSMVSIRLPNDLYQALVRAARRQDTTLTAIVEDFCRGFIDQNYCESCKKKIYGIIPEDGLCDNTAGEEDDEE